jgi:hypothetical protein
VIAEDWLLGECRPADVAGSMQHVACSSAAGSVLERKRLLHNGAATVKLKLCRCRACCAD